MIEKKPARTVAGKPKAGKATTTKDTTKAATARPVAPRTAAWTSGAGPRPGVDLRARIERRAYELWERDGRPEGRDHAHWQQAEREIGASQMIG
jgi:hypothetical protein